MPLRLSPYFKKKIKALVTILLGHLVLAEQICVTVSLWRGLCCSCSWWCNCGRCPHCHKGRYVHHSSHLFPFNPVKKWKSDITELWLHSLRWGFYRKCYFPLFDGCLVSWIWWLECRCISRASLVGVFQSLQGSLLSSSPAAPLTYGRAHVCQAADSSKILPPWTKAMHNWKVTFKAK